MSLGFIDRETWL